MKTGDRVVVTEPMVVRREVSESWLTVDFREQDIHAKKSDLTPVESDKLDLWGVFKDGKLVAAYPHEVAEPELFGETVRRLVAYVVKEPA